MTLIQRFGRVDRITTERAEIYLHNMMPDSVVEGETRVRERVSERVQSFHDLIGLDNVIPENGERVNSNSTYAIYDGEMPEESDAISDSLAVAQEANALLNRIRRERPELWQRLWLMPDGLRAKMTAEEHPNAGSTITLVASGDEKRGYAVNSDGDVAELTNAELVRRVACEPGTPAVLLPPDANARVVAAVAALTEELAPKPAEPEPRRRDDQVTRYVNAQLGQLRLDEQADEVYLRRVELLREAFTAELPVSVNQRVRTPMHDETTGQQLLDALASLESELPKPDGSVESRPVPASNTRVVCSIGIVTTQSRPHFKK